MSRIHPILSPSRWFAIAENYARTHTLLVHTDSQCHFVRSSFEDLVPAKFTKLKSPALVVDMPPLDGYDDNGSPRVGRALEFTVLHKVPDMSRSALVLDLEDLCETIALQIVGKMRQEQTLKLDHAQASSLSLYGQIDLSGLKGECITGALDGAWVGYRVQVPVLHHERRLTYDPSLWNDDAGVPLPTEGGCPTTIVFIVPGEEGEEGYPVTTTITDLAPCEDHQITLGITPDV
jgi:hypothetical protein